MAVIRDTTGGDTVTARGLSFNDVVARPSGSLMRRSNPPDVAVVRRLLLSRNNGDGTESVLSSRSLLGTSCVSKEGDCFVCEDVLALCSAQSLS